MMTAIFTNFFSTPYLLAANGGVGCLLLILLFFFCFGIVHIARLAKIGWSQQKKKKPKPTPKSQPTPPKEKAPAPQQEPVYYIVERKQRRSKPRYGDPKEIRFKD